MKFKFINFYDIFISCLYSVCTLNYLSVHIKQINNSSPISVFTRSDYEIGTSSRSWITNPSTANCLNNSELLIASWFQSTLNSKLLSSGKLLIYSVASRFTQLNCFSNKTDLWAFNWFDGFSRVGGGIVYCKVQLSALTSQSISWRMIKSLGYLLKHFTFWPVSCLYLWAHCNENILNMKIHLPCNAT